MANLPAPRSFHLSSGILAGLTLACCLALPMAVHAAEQMRPGQWQTSLKMKMANMPQIPAEQLEQMRQMGIELPFGDKPMVTQQCITPEQAKLDKPFTPQDQQDCTVKNYKHTGNKVSGDVVCTGDTKATGNFEMALVSDTAYQGKWSLQGSNKDIGVIDQTSEISGKWIKAKCDADVPTPGVMPQGK